MRARVVSVVLTLLAAVVAGILAPAASYADGSGTVVVNDRLGDVATPRLNRHDHEFHLTLAQKRSIDIKRVTFQPVGADIRITIALRQVLRSRQFDQIVHVAWRETSGPEPWAGDVYFDSHSRYGGANYGDPDGDGNNTNCNLRTLSSTRYNTYAVTVPYRCIPAGPLRIGISAITGRANSDAPVPSLDNVVVPGRPVFDPGQY